MNKVKSMLRRAAFLFVVALLSSYSQSGGAITPSNDASTTKNEVWRCKGTYKSAVYKTEKETEIVRYDDGSYTILAPYAEGYDNISFTVNTDGTITPLQGSYSAYKNGYIYLYVEEGHDLIVYADASNSKFVGNRYSGSVYFYAMMCETDYPYGDIGSYGYDMFEWESDEQPSADDLSGMWAGKNYVYDYLGRRGALQVLEGTSDISIAKNEDGTYSIKGFYGGTTDNITATYDKAKKTLTLNPVSGFRSKYTLADFSSPETPIVGYMDDDQNILFTNFTLWEGDTRKTEMDSRCVLRRND